MRAEPAPWPEVNVTTCSAPRAIRFDGAGLTRSSRGIGAKRALPLIVTLIVGLTTWCNWPAVMAPVRPQPRGSQSPVPASNLGLVEQYQLPVRRFNASGTATPASKTALISARSAVRAVKGVPGLTPKLLRPTWRFLLSDPTLPKHAACPLLDMISGLNLTSMQCRLACEAMEECDAFNFYPKEGKLELPACRLLHCGVAPEDAQSWPPTALGPAESWILDGASKTTPAQLGALPRWLHILSIGRVGSSFLLGQLEAAGIRVIFEPFNGAVEGRSLLDDKALLPRLRCIYECGCPQGTFLPHGPAMAVDLLCAERTVAVKTTRVLDLATVAQLPPATLQATRFILLMRDPRAVWHSMSEFRGRWAVANIKFTCEALAMQLRSAPILARVAPVRILWYEHWALAPSTALRELAEWANLLRLPTAWNQSKPEKGKSLRGLSKWARAVPKEEITELEANPYCAWFMRRAGYRPVAEGGTNYTGWTPRDVLNQ